MSENPKRILFVRTDRIGDLILTLPAVSALKKSFPSCFTAFLASPYAAPLLQNHPDINLVLTQNSHASLLESVEKIKEHHFDTAVHFYAEPYSTLVTALAGIKNRIGPFSKLCSLLLNKRVRQNRSRIEKHEAEYNMDLIKICGAEGPPSTPRIYLTDAEKKNGRLLLNSLIHNDEKPILIHPGSKGSVQSWPIGNYLELAKKIAEKIGKVVITGGQGEERYLKRFEGLESSRIYTLKPGSVSLREFASLIQNGKMLISNSTGPLHMAVALGVPTLSFYPHKPVVTSAKRWGPYASEKIHTVLTPSQTEDPLSSIQPEVAFKTISVLDF